MITIEHEYPYFVLQFPYNTDDLRAVKSLPIREWNKKSKKWKVPQLALHTLSGLEAQWTDRAKLAGQGIESTLEKLIEYKFNYSTDEEQGHLFPYQVLGSRYLQAAKKAFLNDDMGLGKTIQSLDAIIRSDPESCLVLCPATLKRNWERQFKLHFNIDPVVISGNAKQRKEQWRSDDTYKIANYDLLARDWDHIPKKWTAIVADELVALKNPKAMRTKLARRLKSDYRIGLSGTAWELDLLEFHSMMSWIRPEILPSMWHFKKRYCYLDFWGNIKGYHHVEELHRLTAPFILRRTKSEVLKDLPDKIYSDIPLELDSGSEKAYKVIVGEIKARLDTMWGQPDFDPLVEVLRLRQFVEFPELLGLEDYSNPRLDWLQMIYREVNKMVVFTPFRQSVNLLQELFENSYIISGKVPQDERLATVEEFEKQGKAILISSDAGRFGLDMVSADTVVHDGYVYNPATMIQREDRLHRIGQEKSVHVLRPFYINTIDEGIRDILFVRQKRQQSFEHGHDAMSRAKLSRDDFRRLMRG